MNADAFPPSRALKRIRTTCENAIMTRWPFRILLLLILGASTTGAAVWCLGPVELEVSTPWKAWTLAADEEARLYARGWKPNPMRADDGSLAYRLYSIVDDSQPGVQQTILREHDWTRYSKVSPPTAVVPTYWLDGDGQDAFRRIRCGWPFAAFEGTARVNNAQDPPAVVLDGLRPLSEQKLVYRFQQWGHGRMQGPEVPRLRGRVVPYHPIWSGVLINSALFGAMWLILVVAVYHGVRLLFIETIRARRGRCVKCSYDLRGEFEKGCPECGWGREDA